MQQQAPWLVAERYEVGEVVGRGGYGMVCRGVDRVTGQAVALKMLSPEAGRDPDIVERMLREQQALVALQGTCAVTPVDLCRLDSGAPCLVMEWLDGRDLEMLLAEREAAGQLGEPAELLALLEPVARTLARAHDIGLVHRDIKPANIFLTSGVGEAPAARLLDFGLSRMKSAAPITAAGMVMGSPSYIAPETWAGDSRALDGRADLFSLAVIVFRWLTGKLPFDAPDLLGKMTAVTTGDRPSMLALRSDLPKAIDAWMRRALAIRPDERFQNGTDFYEALAAAVRGEELPTATAESSGIRKLVTAPDTAPRKSPLASAWQTATSLLKRLTTREESVKPPAPEPPQPVAVPVEEPPASDRLSIWLDPAELEDVASQRAPASLLTPPSAPPPPLAAPTPAPPDASASKRSKAKKKAEKKPKSAKKPKASGKSKKGRKRSKKSG